MNDNDSWVITIFLRQQHRLVYNDCFWIIAITSAKSIRLYGCNRPMSVSNRRYVWRSWVLTITSTIKYNQTVITIKTVKQTIVTAINSAIWIYSDVIDWLIVLGFNDTSTLEGHFVSSPREREKRDRRESRGDEREGQGRKRNRKESRETEEIKTFPLFPYPLQG